MNDMQMEGVETDTKTVQKQGYPEGVLETVPELYEGLNLLEVSGDLPVFQEVLAHELGPGEKALWIDTGNRASTYALSSADQVLMEKVSVSRAFTPFQHHTAVQRIEENLEEDTSVIVLPLITALYIDSGMSSWEMRELFIETLEEIKHIQQENSLRIAVSLPGEEELASIVRSEADRKIRVRKTDQGVRYSSEGFIQRSYRNSGMLQTTIPMWRKV